MTSSPGFTAKLFDELTLHELQQIHITRTLVFAAGQKITEPEADETDFECVHFFSADDSGRVLAYLRMLIWNMSMTVITAPSQMHGRWVVLRYVKKYAEMG